MVAYVMLGARFGSDLECTKGMAYDDVPAPKGEIVTGSQKWKGISSIKQPLTLNLESRGAL